jgi:DNA (cytosine-5)-methyltransferase 1
MRILDLFCKAGGAGKGYAMAGFTVVGVDCEPQKNYPFEFHQSDALEFLRRHGREFDAVHASPPCQAFSLATFNRPDLKRQHVDLVGPVRKLLLRLGKPYVIENVPKAPLLPSSVTLCGLMFPELKVFRHRLFETNWALPQPAHPSHSGHRIGVNGMCSVAGHGDASWRYRGRGRPAELDDAMCQKAAWERAMGIGWMTRDELAQAIPPAYTRYVGTHLMARLRGEKNVA